MCTLKRTDKGKEKEEKNMEEPWLLEQREQEKYQYFLSEKPGCDRCGRTILDFQALNLEGRWYCPDCVRRCTQEVKSA